MRRFFGRDDDEGQPVAEDPDSDDGALDLRPPTFPSERPGSPEPAAVVRAVRSSASTEGAADPWDLDLTPALRQTPRESAPPDTVTADAPTQGPAAIAARLDMLQSTMRAFRDTVGTRLSDYSGALSRLSEADQETTRKLARLQADFSTLAASVTTVAEDLREMVIEIRQAGLPAAVSDLAAYRHWAEQQATAVRSSVEAQATETRAMVTALSAELHATVGALSSRLDGIELSIAGVGQELQLLRRRIPVVRRAPEPRPPEPPEGRRRRR